MNVTTKEKVTEWVGKDLGTSDWLEVNQDRINQFADVTEDHQFIHIDPEAAAKTPFGGTVAHGFLTLSLLVKLAEKNNLAIEGVFMGVNYGFDKIRFIQPVPSGARIRGHFKVKSVTEKNAGQFLIAMECSVEIEGQDKPALIADWLSMQFVN